MEGVEDEERFEEGGELFEEEVPQDYGCEVGGTAALPQM